MAGFLGDGFLGGKGKGGGQRGEPGKAGSTPAIGANGNWFISGVDTGVKAGGIDLSQFKENEVISVDAKTGKLKPSGVFAHDGEVETEPDSIIIGSHELSSSAENIIVTNKATQKLYSPLWQEIAPNVSTAFIRGHLGLETVDRFTGSSTRYTNPMFDLVMDEDQTSFSLTTNFVNAATNVVLEVYLGKEKLYRSRWDSVQAGEVKLPLNTPADFKKGVTYSIKFYSTDGDITLKGGKRGPRWSVERVKWVDIEIATQDWVKLQPSSNPVTHVGLIGVDRLQMTHADGTKNVLALPSQGGSAVDLTPLRDDIAALERVLTTQGNDVNDLKAKYGNLEHSLNDLHSTYVYNGSSLPAYPSDPQGRYFITLQGQAARDIDINMPDHFSADMKDGTMYYLENDNAQAVVNLNSASDQTIGKAATLTIQPKTHVLLFKSGADWLIAMNKSTATVSTQVSTQDVENAIDHGEFTGSGSMKDLDFGWHVVKVSNAGVTGRPNDSQSDLIVFKQGVNGSTSKPGYGVMFAFGKDTNNADAMWAMYRDGSVWTPWFKVNGGTSDLTKIIADIALLKGSSSSMKTDIANLQTSVGSIYAPNKAVFDAAVNALIDAKIAAIPHGGGGSSPQKVKPRFTVTMATGLPTSLTGSVSSTNGEATFTRTETSRQRLWILVAPSDESKVESVSVNGGLASEWEDRDVTINNILYKGFYSSGAYTETEFRIRVNFK